MTSLFQQKDCTVTGVDLSQELLEIARNKFPEAQFLPGDFLHIPAKDNSFDEVWAVASFHHLPTQKMRLQALQEISRVLTPNGEVILTNWNLWDQEKYEPQKKQAFWKSLFFPWWKKRDFLIPWGTEKLPRYYHSFCIKNLLNLARKSGFIVLEYWGSQKGKKGEVKGSENICMRLKKETHCK